jgi:hypothetical protein
MVRRDLPCAFLAAGKVSLAGARGRQTMAGWGKMGTDRPDELDGGLLRSGRAGATVVRMLLGHPLTYIVGDAR